MKQHRIVLIVDDSPSNRGVYRQFLLADSESTYLILEAASASAALGLCRSRPIECVLFRLPELDGLEFLAQLQVQMNGNAPPVILIADRSNERIAVQAIKRGAEDFLASYQITAEILQQSVRSAIANTQFRSLQSRAPQYFDADRSGTDNRISHQFAHPSVGGGTEQLFWQDAEQQHQNNPAPAEQQLQQSLRFIEQIVAIAPCLVYVYDLVEQRNVYVNRQVTELLGYTPEQLQHLGTNLFAHLMHPEDLARLPALLQRFDTAQDSEILEAEYRMRHADGNWRWLFGREMVFTRNPDGSPRQVVGTALDITERKQAEADLQISHERFELAAAAVNCLIYDWHIRDRTVARSQGILPLLGFTPAEAGTSLEWWSDRIHPADMEIIQAQIEADSATANRYSHDYRVRHREGHYVWVQDHAVIVRDATGEPMRIVGSTTSIDDRKRTEAALRQSESLFRGVFESNLIGIVFWNIQGQITDANDTFLQMTGYSRAELQAGTIYYSDITPAEYHELDAKKFETLQTTGTYTPIEKEYICKDGSRIPILVGCAFLPGSQEQGVAFVLDISEQKQLQQERESLLLREQAARAEAERANRTKDEFLAVVSHELRSPLNAILGWSRLLQTRRLDQATIERALNTIERNTVAQVQLIEDLLDVSRMLRGTLRITLAPVNLATIIETTLNSLRPLAEAKQLHLQFQRDPSVKRVLGDPHRLQQIISNLLSNAIKFTPEGGAIEICLSGVVGRVESPLEPPIGLAAPLQPLAQITISDSGKGIAPDLLPHVFERFRRADSSTTRSQDGLGLGLAIVKHLVELHHGSVSAESSGEGQGATFTVQLPMLRNDNPNSPSVRNLDLNNSIEGMSIGLTGIRILVVDDEADTRDYVTFTLQECGAIVRSAASAQEALEQFQTFKPNVLLSDIGMPEQDGYTLLQQVRALKLGGQIPAIALTAYTRDRDRDRALQAGFQQYVTKPVEPTELVTAIARLSRSPIL